MKKIVIITLVVFFATLSVSAQDSFLSFSSTFIQFTDSDGKWKEAEPTEVLITCTDNTTFKVYSKIPRTLYKTKQNKTTTSERGNEQYHYELVDTQKGEEVTLYIEFRPENRATLTFFFEDFAVTYWADVNW